MKEIKGYLGIALFLALAIALFAIGYTRIGGLPEVLDHKALVVQGGTFSFQDAEGPAFTSLREAAVSEMSGFVASGAQVFLVVTFLASFVGIFLLEILGHVVNQWC